MRKFALLPDRGDMTLNFIGIFIAIP